jgi:hypothetical protein
MGTNALPSPEYLRQRLRYDYRTGKLYWRDDATKNKTWRTRYAGTEAFTADNGKGYRMGRLDYSAHQAHRVIWAMHYGFWPQTSLDHINHDRTDNRIENLREATVSENQKNQSKHRSNTSGATGVYWYARYDKWMASITADGIKHHLGYFADKELAIAARKAAEAQYGFHANHGVKAA